MTAESHDINGCFGAIMDDLPYLLLFHSGCFSADCCGPEHAMRSLLTKYTNIPSPKLLSDCSLASIRLLLYYRQRIIDDTVVQ